MRSRTNGTIQRGQKLNRFQGEGPNWLFIAGGAFLSTLSVRLGCKIKQAFETQQENRKLTCEERSGECQLHSNLYHFNQDEDTRHRCLSGMSGDGEDITQPKNLMSKEVGITLPLVKFQEAEPNKDSGGVLWASPDCLELPQKPFHHSSCSDSTCVSESGSDIYSKREMVQKLRQQLKRRDEMIMEMQAQMIGLQNSLSIQMAQSAHLQAQIDAANRDLSESEREIQRLRKIITDHCVAEVIPLEKPAKHWWCPEATHGTTNGYPDGVDDLELHCIGTEEGNGDLEKVEMLKREVGELKDVIEGKDFLIKSYKEQKLELCSKIKEMQLKLDSHVPNIL